MPLSSSSIARSSHGDPSDWPWSPLGPGDDPLGGRGQRRPVPVRRPDQQGGNVRFIGSRSPALRQLPFALLSSSRLKSSRRSTTALAMTAIDAPPA